MATTADPSLEALAEEVAAQSALVNELKKQQADEATVEEARKKLGDLKKTLMMLQHAAAGGAKKKKERMLLKTPKVCSRVLSRRAGSSSYARLRCYHSLCYLRTLPSSGHDTRLRTGTWT